MNKIIMNAGKIFALLITVCFSLPAIAAAWKYGGLWFEYKVEHCPMYIVGGVHVVAPPDTCPAYSGDIYIPDSVIVRDSSISNYNDKLPVSKIDDGIFANVTSVTFDDECTSAFGFTGCANLTTVALGKRTKTIANNAFKNCTNLTQINLDSITSIGDSAFVGCHQLKSLLLPSIESIGAGAFKNCTGLTKLELPNGKLQVIGKEAFKNCVNLQTATIRFSESPTITTRTIYTASIGNRLSENSYRINLVSEKAFEGCVELTSLTLDYTGYKTNYLVKVVFDPYAFKGCSKLQSISSGSYYLYLDKYSLYNCTGLKTVSLTQQGRITGGAFWGCSSLQKIYLGKYAEVYYDSPHMGLAQGCTNLEEYEVYSKSGCCFKLVDGMLYGKYDGAYCLVSRPAAAAADTFIVPSSTSRILYSAFAHNKFKHIQLHNEIVEIGDYAFYECKNLRSITIPEGITTIADRTFCGCDSLESVTIPKSVTSLGNFSFAIDSWNYYYPGTNGTLRKVVVYNPDPPYDYDPSYIRGSKQYYYPFAFRNIYDYCTLYVPAGSKAKYRYWGDSPLSNKEYFNYDNIIEMEDDGVGDVVTDHTAPVPVAYYDLQGHKLASPEPGLNIVRYSDGTAKKVLTK